MRLLLPFLLLSLCAGLHAQDCFYQLVLEDSNGDGWNGARLTVSVDGVPRSYTLDAMNDDGQSRNFYLPVNDGDPIVIGYATGAFPEEVSFSLLDNNDSLIYTVDAPMAATNLASFTAECRTCAPPPFSSIELYRVRYNSVDIRFRGGSASTDPIYRIEYGTGDFDPETDEDGETVTTQDTMLRISGLDANTPYRFFVSTICQSSNDTTVRRGPFNIMTQLRRDVGVTALTRPFEDCVRAGVDSVTIGITNFGGEAQQFFKVDFTINGDPGGVTTPFDGIYTGVVGVDSTEFFTFDAVTDLREPGYYTIEAFTLLEDDENPENDTFRTTVLSLPVITDFPYTEDFEMSNGFWRGGRFGRGPDSWERGVPRGNVIDRAGSGSQAFVTNLDGNYNADERSYLQSPCFNFSGIDYDPFISFLLYVDTEENFDQLYLEASTDGGESWDVIEASPTDINWYNNLRDQAWDGDGGFNGGYRLVGSQLTGYQGEEEVQFRFVFESDGDTQREGVAIDRISIGERKTVDYAAVSASYEALGICADPFTDVVEFSFTNLGTQAVDSVTVGFTINGQGPATVRAAAPSTFGGFATVRIPNELLDFPDGEVLVEAWVTAVGDEATGNDTVTFSRQLFFEPPFLEDFENGQLPYYWYNDGNFSVDASADGSSTVLTGEFMSTNQELGFRTAPYGRFMAGDSLRFSLSVNGEQPNENAQVALTIQAISPECDAAFGSLLDTITGGGVFVLSLDELVGEFALFEFLINPFSDGEITIDFDDFSIRRCDDLEIGIDIAQPSTVFADDATVYLDPMGGVFPYTFQWSTGDTTQSVDSLSVASYTVMVTDAVGCTETASIMIDFDVAVDEPGELLTGLEVFPNPTQGRLEIKLDLQSRADLGLEVYDGTGRRIKTQNFGTTDRLNTSIDLADYPAGLYFLRVRAGALARTVRVVKR